MHTLFSFTNIITRELSNSQRCAATPGLAIWHAGQRIPAAGFPGCAFANGGTQASALRARSSMSLEFPRWGPWSLRSSYLGQLESTGSSNLPSPVINQSYHSPGIKQTSTTKKQHKCIVVTTILGIYNTISGVEVCLLAFCAAIQLFIRAQRWQLLSASMCGYPIVK